MYFTDILRITKKFVQNNIVIGHVYPSSLNLNLQTKIKDELLVYFRNFQNVSMVKTNYSGVKSLIKFLKSGNCIGILPDQVPGRGAGKWTPFFAKLAYTSTLVIRLAKLTSAPIAWISCLKSSKGWKFSVDV